MSLEIVNGPFTHHNTAAQSSPLASVNIVAQVTSVTTGNCSQMIGFRGETVGNRHMFVVGKAGQELYGGGYMNRCIVTPVYKLTDRFATEL